MSVFVVNLLERFLGTPKKHNETKGQIAFDCPACAVDKGKPQGDGKGNLEVNYNRGVFRCWSCMHTNNMHGFIPKLIKRWGNKEILTEYQRVGEELSSKYPEIDIAPIIDLITIYGEVVETKNFSASICEDPDDNKFIDCAISSNCKLIVSGDKHLLKISGFQDIEVLKPREFIDLHLK